MTERKVSTIPVCSGSYRREGRESEGRARVSNRTRNSEKEERKRVIVYKEQGEGKNQDSVLWNISLYVTMLLAQNFSDEIRQDLLIIDSERHRQRRKEGPCACARVFVSKHAILLKLGSKSLYRLL